jgi:hypothetical protein
MDRTRKFLIFVGIMGTLVILTGFISIRSIRSVDDVPKLVDSEELKASILEHVKKLEQAEESAKKFNELIEKDGKPIPEGLGEVIAPTISLTGSTKPELKLAPATATSLPLYTVTGEKPSWFDSDVRPISLYKVENAKSPEEALIFNKVQSMLKETEAKHEWLKQRRVREDAIIASRQEPKARSSANPVTVNILCGKCRWNHMDYFTEDWVRGCSVPCKFVPGRQDLEKSDLILEMENTGHVPTLSADPKLKNKKFGVFTLESIVTQVCNGMGVEEWKQCMDRAHVHISFSRQSDALMTYSYGLFPGGLIQESHTQEDVKKYMKEANEKALKERNIEFKDVIGSTWVSNCVDTRYKYMEHLALYLPIHHYGVCLNNGHAGRSFKKVLQQQKYRFSFAFENTFEYDYHSEKFFEGLLSSNVMVYMGPPNSLDSSPVVGEKVFINALDYMPHQLAELLAYLAKNEKAYLEYTKWRTKPLSQSFLDYIQKSFTLKGPDSWLCRTCEYYHKRFD